MSLPDLIPRDAIRARLLEIFPDGMPRRANVTTQTAASTVFASLYVGAVEGSGEWLSPKVVYRMTEEQSGLIDSDSRLAYITALRRGGTIIPGVRWYQDNSREGIRDDTLREGLVTLGAVIERTDVAVTANKPRYALSASFAALFDPSLTGKAFDNAVAAWRAATLSAGALARIAIVRKGAATGGTQVLITFPNGESRRMKPGPSAEITKAVVEVFAPTFLGEPAVILVSESGNKIVARDDELARQIGLNIKAEKDLPDAILVDLAPEHPLLVFVEVVATDGPISDRRMSALSSLVSAAGFPSEHVAYVTAYLDRSHAPFKKTAPSLAWGSYAWFAAEPGRIMILSGGGSNLSELP